MNFEVEGDVLKDLASFENDSRWGASHLGHRFRLVEVTSKGCQVRDSSLGSCDTLISKQVWDETEVAMLKVEGLTLAMFQMVASQDFSPENRNVIVFSNVLIALTALEQAGVPAVSFGAKKSDAILGRALGPAYHGYTIRNHLNDVYAGTAPCKTKIARFVQKGGTLPNKQELEKLITPNECDMGVARSEMLPNTGTIVVQFSQGEESPVYLHDKAVWFTVDLEEIFAKGVFIFECNSNMPSKYLPTECIPNQEFGENIR